MTDREELRRLAEAVQAVADNPMTWFSKRDCADLHELAMHVLPLLDQFDALEAELARLRREIEYRCYYGNKDSQAYAEEAMKEGRLDE